MRKENIEVVIKRRSINILTAVNQFSFGCVGNEVSFFSTVELKSKQLDEIESSKIIEIESCKYNHGCYIIMKTKLGYTNEKMIDVLIDLIEKHNL